MNPISSQPQFSARSRRSRCKPHGAYRPEAQGALFDKETLARLHREQIRHDHQSDAREMKAAKRMILGAAQRALAEGDAAKALRLFSVACRMTGGRDTECLTRYTEQLFRQEKYKDVLAVAPAILALSTERYEVMVALEALSRSYDALGQSEDATEYRELLAMVSPQAADSITLSRSESEAEE